MGFKKKLPEKEGIPSLLLRNMMERWEKQLCHVHGYLILRHGNVIAEAYRYPYSEGSKRIVHSVSKTFTAAAIGIAVEEGSLALDDKVLSFFPEYNCKEATSEYLQEMTIKHLLTMTTGHEMDSMYSIMGTGKEIWRAFLDTPVVYQPGTHFTYDSGATYMLSKILTAVTGELLCDYLNKRLFIPLEMEGIQWDEMEEANTGGWGACVSMEDMAKLGQLFLQKGMWMGKRILSEKWVEEAGKCHIATKDSHIYRDWKEGYGYQMWRCGREGCYRADGAFGQFILVLPPKDMTVVIWSEDAFSQDMLDAFWEEVYDKAGDEVYGIDGIAYEEYRKKCIAWGTPPIGCASCSYLEMAIQGQRFRTGDCSGDDVKGMTFSFTGNGQMELKVEKENSSTILYANNTFAHFGQAKINFEVASFISLGKLREKEKKYAATYQWITDHTLRIHMIWLDTAHYTDITCVFTDKEMTAVFSQSYKKFLLDSQECAALALREMTFHGFIKNQE